MSFVNPPCVSCFSFCGVSKHSPKAQYVFSPFTLFPCYQVTPSALFMLRSKHLWCLCWAHKPDASHVKGLTHQATSKVQSHDTSLPLFLSITLAKLQIRSHMILSNKRIAEVFCFRCFSWGKKKLVMVRATLEFQRSPNLQSKVSDLNMKWNVNFF